MPKTCICLNYGNCEKADTRELIAIPDGADLVCPECGAELFPSPLQYRPRFSRDWTAQAKFYSELPLIEQGILSSQGKIFMGLCRAVSIISGGFLLGNGFSHGSILFSILGTVVGVVAFAFSEVFIRREA